MPRINRTISVEDLITSYPGSVRFLVDRGIPCLVCGEPVWGTLHEVLQSAGKSEEEITALLEELSAAVAED